MKRPATIFLALLGIALALATPAAGQQSGGVRQWDGVDDPRYRTPETQRLNRAISEADAEYQRLDAKAERLWGSPEGMEAQGRVGDTGEEIDRLVEALITARLEAIREAPVSGSDAERVAALEDKRDALGSLNAYAAVRGYSSTMSDTGDELDEALEANDVETEAVEDGGIVAVAKASLNEEKGFAEEGTVAALANAHERYPALLGLLPLAVLAGLLLLRRKPNRAPGGGDSTSDGWDEGRRVRNVAGAKGEARVNRVLASLTGDLHCYVFANLREENIGNIDHVFVSGAGLVVVETKANSGEAVLNEYGELTVGGRPLYRDPFEQAIRQLRALGRRVALPADEGDYRVCLAGASGLRRTPGAPNADRVLTLDELPDALRRLDERLPEEKVDELAESIMGSYGAAPIASPADASLSQSQNLRRAKNNPS